MKIFKEKAGVFSLDPVWVCFESHYMYDADTLITLIWLIITEWRHDRHLIG